MNDRFPSLAPGVTPDDLAPDVGGELDAEKAGRMED